MANRAWLFTPLAFLLTLQTQGNALKLIKLTVPVYKIKGEMAILECDYELEKEVLYAVKWYKDNEEFYRFVPKLDPHQQSFKVEGIKVDHQLSDSKQVALRGVNLKSSGLYRCEVSAEAPAFVSADNEARMEVVYLPKDGPHISGTGEREYQVGDKINLNCTSGRSFPASVLHWYINDMPVQDTDSLIQYPEVVHQHGLVSSTLGLELTISNSHFTDDRQMRVRCVANVSPVLWKSDKESVVQRVAPLLGNREALIFVKGTSAAKTATIAKTLIIGLVLLRFFIS